MKKKIVVARLGNFSLGEYEMRYEDTRTNECQMHIRLRLELLTFVTKQSGAASAWPWEGL